MKYPGNRPFLLEVQDIDGLWGRHWLNTERRALALAEDYISHDTIARCIVTNAETDELIDDLGWPTWGPR